MIILPTIDVEGVHGSQPFEQMILGDIGRSESWGVFRLARIFQRFGISATFFVDCYEYTLWGADNMERVCHQLANMGQDVQLHTHPAWRDDPRDADWLRKYKRENAFLTPERDFMAKLSYEEQVEVLQAGIALMQKWLGRRPIAHRSGGYSINADTIHALRNNGIAIDSSMNAAHPNSKVVWAHNRVEERDGVLEIPVTVMNYALRLPAIRGHKSPFRRLAKTDISVCSQRDLRAFVEQGNKHGLKVMNLFMHSYSLLRLKPLLRAPFSSLRPSMHNLRTLESFLEFAISDPRIRFMNCSQILKAYRRAPADFAGPDFIPTVYSHGTVLRYGASRLSDTVTRYWPKRGAA